MSAVVYIGNICIGLALACAVFGMIAYFAGQRIRSDLALLVGRGMVYATFVLLTIANLAMVRALLTDDFAVSYVAHVGSRETPRWISAISLWSSLEGSILFWGWILTAYAAAAVYSYRREAASMMAWVGLTLLAVELFFFLLLALPANPFQPVMPVPANGPGPNPLLQNHWLMALHPPCLYLGYIGFTVPFALGVAALLERDRSGQWAVLARRWTLFAWAFLTIAIVLGGWWSYAVLGWGGYWAWDPVENASFMPWLSGTALVHSLIVQERRRLLPVWNLFLAVLTFLLTILGTFLTRSGVLDSVHSFTESHIGAYFLGFIGVVFAVSTALLLWRGADFRQPGRIEKLLSLEVLFLFNNLLFLSFCFIVFLGTLYPLAIEAVRGTRISVGEPYFNQMTIPIAGMILLLMSLGMVTPWRSGSGRRVVMGLRWPALGAVLVAGAMLVGGVRSFWVLAVTAMAVAALGVMLVEWVQVGWQRAGRSWSAFPRACVTLPAWQPRRYCGFIAHAGVLIVMVAVALSSSYEWDHEITVKPGESVPVRGYTLTLAQMEAREAPQRYEIRARVEVAREGRKVGELTPQMNYYPTSREPIGSPAIRSTWREDLYLTLISFEKDGSSVALRAIVTPAVMWIWIGGLVMLAGGLLAWALRRRPGVEGVASPGFAGARSHPAGIAEDE